MLILSKLSVMWVQANGKFGSKSYLTNNFKHIGCSEKYLVSASRNTFWWNASMKIGFGFKYEETRLFLRPFISGWIYSGGAKCRFVHFGFAVSSIMLYSSAKMPKITQSDENIAK